MDYEDLWVVVAITEKDKPSIVRMNIGLKSVAPHPEYCYRVGIAIPCLHPQENGMPNENENAIFLKIEDKIMQYFDLDKRGLVFAFITGQGHKEFVTYSKISDIQEIIDKLKKEFSQHDIQCYVELDKSWAGYKQIRRLINQ